MAIRRKACRQAKKKLAEKILLKRSKKVGAVIRECPGIGQEIESFVRQCSAGADMWRRTGTSTFDGNSKLEKKPTFKLVKEHLETKYNQQISYGTVVQLCIPRNKRRRSAARYKVLQMCFRREREKDLYQV